MSKIIGVTVGTTMSPKTIKDKLNPVLSVNDVEPDSNGNVHMIFTIDELTEEQKALLKGDKGDKGDAGYTPRKNIDYFDGKNGKDGTDGKDGYTPVKGVDYFDGKNGQDGAPGKDGQDGRTPVKGTDYWTASDKSEIVADVLTALPTWSGGSY